MGVDRLARIGRIAHFPRSKGNSGGETPVDFWQPAATPCRLAAVQPGWLHLARKEAGEPWAGTRHLRRARLQRAVSERSGRRCTMLLARCLGTALLLLLAPTTGCVAAVAASAAASEPDGDIGAPCPSSSPAGCDSPESDRKATCDDEKACGVREEGESCGVYTPSCAGGLRCVPRPGERTPLQALLRGKGICLAPQPKRGGSKNQTEMEPVAGDGRRENYQTDHPTQEPLLLQIQDPLPDVMVDKSQLQQDPLNQGIKQEFDMGPCRMHLAAILQELKAPLYMNGEDIFIPNCDTKGFYRRKQCRTSKGQKRGRCWCVDKRGHRLEGLEESPLCLLANND